MKTPPTRSCTNTPHDPQSPPSDVPPTGSCAAPSPAPPPSRTPAEQALVDAWGKRNRDLRLPEMVSKETPAGPKLSPSTSDLDLWITQLADLLKTDSPALLAHLYAQVSRCVWKTEEEHAFNLTIAALVGIGPRDQLETLLAVQMVSVHNVAMELLRRTLIPDQTSEGVTIGVQRATQLLRTFTTQMETLVRYRGGGKQTVTVQHVQVDAGGQAIVGNIHHGLSQLGAMTLS